MTAYKAKYDKFSKSVPELCVVHEYLLIFQDVKDGMQLQGPGREALENVQYQRVDAVNTGINHNP